MKFHLRGGVTEARRLSFRLMRLEAMREAAAQLMTRMRLGGGVFPRGMPEGLIERLAAEQVYVAARLGRMRISPHVYNDEADVDRFIAVMRGALGR